MFHIFATKSEDCEEKKSFDRAERLARDHHSQTVGQ
jgi:hypothetical protein